ncbi:Hypothetical predicted protein [Marmota monax]|uniref:Uncharacterized protein n=1 Tax=Marmota monax TaxID=9995 RepID=A0A5E4AZS5_MARMO|nr:hypothetical protein GHT09_019740 [Marmota monax]VTJ62963.1 Hypothetical predicted protein [Marmota monax]
MHELKASLASKAFVLKREAAIHTPKACCICAPLTMTLGFALAGPSCPPQKQAGFQELLFPLSPTPPKVDKGKDTLTTLCHGVPQPLNFCIPTVCSLPQPQLYYFWMCLLKM